MSTRPRCLFSVRYPAGGGKWRYQRLTPNSPVTGLELAYPPAQGDLIALWDGDKTRPQPEGGPVFLVVSRMWSHPAGGSSIWPYGQVEPSLGPLLEVVVEPSAGPYQDEAPVCGELECEAVLVHGAWWTPPGAPEPGPHEHRQYDGGQASR